MNWLDYVLLLIALMATVGGIRRGFARTIIGIVTVLAATVGAIWMYGTAASFFTDYVSHGTIASLLGFLIVFGAIMAVGGIIGWIVQRAMKAAGLGWLDRIFGAAIGLLQATLVAVALIMAITAFSRTPPPRSIVESKIAPYVSGASAVLAEMAPRELRDGFQGSYDQVKKSWKEMMDAGLRKLPAGAY